MKLYKKLASLVGAHSNCIKDKNKMWELKHYESIQALVKEHMPSGSGFDDGTSIDLFLSTDNKLVFHASYHHMNEIGYYDGWTNHKITVVPHLSHGIGLSIGGKNKNEIKPYIESVFDHALDQEIED